jgi:hypothetical protein
MDTKTFTYKIDRVDTARHEVHGTLAHEILDSDGEVFDYFLSKPHFIAWSNSIFEKSKGKSRGNIRSMHGSVAAGKVLSMTFDDPAKRIRCVGKVTDEGEWSKCEDGTLIGFSLSGRLVGKKRFTDETGQTRYEVAPFEVSLVDNPAIPTAIFDAVKMEGKMRDDPKAEAKKDISGNDLHSFADVIGQVEYLVRSLVSVLPSDGLGFAGQLKDLQDYLLAVLAQRVAPENVPTQVPAVEVATETETETGPTPDAGTDMPGKSQNSNAGIEEELKLLRQEVDLIKSESQQATILATLKNQSDAIISIKDRVVKMEKTPLGGGPRLNLEGKAFEQGLDEATIIARMIESEKDPHIRQALGIRQAAIMIQKNKGGTK